MQSATSDMGDPRLLDLPRTWNMTGYEHMFDILQGIQDECEARHGEKPSDRKSKQQLYRESVQGRRIFESLKDEGRELEPMTTVLPLPYNPCTLPISELKPIAIKNLQLEVRHCGKYIVLRAITPPVHAVAITSVMEDEYGDGVLVQLHHRVLEKSREITDVVNTGTILLIKEPYFKGGNDGEYRLRVDHISDAVELKDDNKMIPNKWRQPPTTTSAGPIKAQGNAAMGKQKYWDAIKL